MKIKVNKQVKEKMLLLEGTPVAAGASTSSSSTSPDLQELYGQDVEKIWMAQQRRNSIPMDIKMPSIFNDRFNIRQCPDNLSVIMRPLHTASTNADEKFNNFHGMMNDPVGTYDRAEDIARSMFGKVENLKDSLSDKKSELGKVRANQKNVSSSKPLTSDNVDTTQDESYYYNGYDQLNESVGTFLKAGVNFGHIVGSVGYAAGEGIGGTLAGAGGLLGAGGGLAFTGAALGTLAGAGVFMALSAIPMMALGKFGEGLQIIGERFGGDIDPAQHIDDSQLQDETNLYVTYENSNDDSDKNFMPGEAYGAINEYLNQVITSVSEALSLVTSDHANSTKFVKKVRQYIRATDDVVKAYVEKTQENVLRFDKEQRLDKAKHTALLATTNQVQTLVQKYIGPKIQEAMAKGDGTADKYMKLMMWLTGTKTKKEEKIIDDLIEYAEKGEFDKLLNYATKKQIITESVKPNTDKYLFEGETEAQNSTALEFPVIDAEKYYNTIVASFSDEITDMFENGKNENLPGYKEAKEGMERLITAADKEIKDKIKYICKTAGDKDAGLSDKVSAFLAKHPMKEAGLERMWAEHYEDLQQRKIARLQKMSSYNPSDGVLGWTAHFCQTVVPDVIARMLTYRYILGVLKEQGYYTFDSPRERALKEQFQASRGAIMSTYVMKIKFLLYKFGNDYTATDGFVRYGSLLVINLEQGIFDKLRDQDIAWALALANTKINDDSNVWIVGEIITRTGLDNLLTDENPDTLAELGKRMEMSDDQKKLKDTIKSTYDYITSIPNRYTNDEEKRIFNVSCSASHAMVQNNKNLFVSSGKSIFNLISSYKPSDGKLSDTQIQDAHNKLKKIITIPDVDLSNVSMYDFLNAIDQTKHSELSNVQIDYYAYIMSFYDSLHINEIFNVKSKRKDIGQICNAVKVYFQLITSGILTAGVNMDKHNSLFNMVAQKMKDFHEEPTKKTFGELYATLTELSSSYNEGDTIKLPDVPEDFDIYDDINEQFENLLSDPNEQQKAEKYESRKSTNTGNIKLHKPSEFMNSPEKLDIFDYPSGGQHTLAQVFLFVTKSIQLSSKLEDKEKEQQTYQNIMDTLKYYFDYSILVKVFDGVEELNTVAVLIQKFNENPRKETFGALYVNDVMNGDDSILEKISDESYNEIKTKFVDLLAHKDEIIKSISNYHSKPTDPLVLEPSEYVNISQSFDNPNTKTFADIFGVTGTYRKIKLNNKLSNEKAEDVIKNTIKSIKYYLDYSILVVTNNGNDRLNGIANAFVKFESNQNKAAFELLYNSLGGDPSTISLPNDDDTYQKLYGQYHNILEGGEAAKTTKNYLVTGKEPIKLTQPDKDKFVDTPEKITRVIEEPKNPENLLDILNTDKKIKILGKLNDTQKSLGVQLIIATLRYYLDYSIMKVMDTSANTLETFNKIMANDAATPFGSVLSVLSGVATFENDVNELDGDDDTTKVIKKECAKIYNDVKEQIFNKFNEKNGGEYKIADATTGILICQKMSENMESATLKTIISSLYEIKFGDKLFKDIEPNVKYTILLSFVFVIVEGAKESGSPLNKLMKTRRALES